MNQRAETRPKSSLRIVLGGAVLFILGLLVVAGAKGYRDLQSVRGRETVLKERVVSTETRIEELKYRLELMQDDPATLERLAREELGMVGPDDLVFVLPVTTPTAP